jgi:hypothetical protein
MLWRLHAVLIYLSVSLIVFSQSSLAEDETQVCQIPSTDTFADLIKTIDDLKCVMVPTADSPHYQKDLSTYWAQEYVGADLVRERLIAENLSPKPGLIVAWDNADNDNDESHGTLVSNLMIGPTKSALIPGPSIPFSPLYQNKNYKYAASYNQLSGCLEAKNCPSYINNSMHWWTEEDLEIGAVVEKLSEQSVFITIAGNETKSVELSKKKLADQSKLLIVGSTDPLGFGSDFSSYSASLTISAPSDNLLTSEVDGKSRKFGGTSGAAPQVSAALAAFTLISGYKLSTSEAKNLLQKTALSFPHYPSPNSLGAGILNSYKISEVAYKLRDKCKNRKACFEQELKDEKTYDFGVDAREQLSKAEDVFPECFGKKNEITIGKESCNERKVLFNEIRKKALLNHHNSKAWDFISCVSRNDGMTKNAEFYKALSNRSKLSDEALLKKLVETDNAKDLFSFHLTHPSWADKYNWVDYFIKDSKNDYLIFNSILSRPELTDKSDWFNKLSSKPSNNINVMFLFATDGMVVHHNMLSDFIDKSDPATDKQIVKMVLKKSEWIVHPELLEQIAKKGTADKEIEEMILSSKEWQRVLTQKFKTASITIEQLRADK